MTCRPLSAPPPTDAPTEGPQVCRWIETHCRYGEGDKFGQPVRLEPFQRYVLYLLYELNEDGSRRYRRFLLEMPKGNGKTPLAAWIALYELCGPGRVSPLVPVAAASYGQADLLYGDMRACVEQSPTLSEVLETFEGEIQIRGGAGRAYKVAAVAGTNDGQRPSCFCADELHEWEGRKERVHLVIANGCSKRHGSLQVNTTTPGWNIDSLAGRLHEYGLKVNNGEVEDRSFLFICYGVDDGTYNLDDPKQLEAAVRAANPASDSFLSVEDTVARYYQVARSEFCRYHLGQWVKSQEFWLPPGTWEACQDAELRPESIDVPIVLAFDGSFNGDSTGIVACTVEEVPRTWVVAAWEKPEDDTSDDWRVPVLDVEETIRQACDDFEVLELAADAYRWQRSLQVLEDEGLPVVEFPQNPSRMTPATSAFYEAVLNRQIQHDGDPRLTRHLSNATLKVDSRGQQLAKESKHSTRRIDLAVCVVMAHARARALLGTDEGEINIW